MTIYLFLSMELSVSMSVFFFFHVQMLLRPAYRFRERQVSILSLSEFLSFSASLSGFYRPIKQNRVFSISVFSDLAGCWQFSLVSLPLSLKPAGTSEFTAHIPPKPGLWVRIFEHYLLGMWRGIVVRKILALSFGLKTDLSKFYCWAHLPAYWV